MNEFSRSTDLVLAKEKTMEIVVKSMLFWSFYFDVSDAWRITMSYQYIETFSDEVVKRY